MNRVLLTRLLMCGLLMVSWMSAQALSLREPDFPAPPDASVEIVSNNMEINGISTQVRAFTSRDKVDKVTEYYKKLWKDGVAKGLPGYTVTNAMQPWILITRVEDGYMMTVQVQKKDDGGSWGYLAMSKVPSKPEPPKLGVKIPKMHDATVVNEVKSRDPGQTGRSVQLMSPHSVSSNVSFYRNYYQNQGWSTDLDRSLEIGKMHAFSFKRGRERVNIMIMGDHRETRVVVNEVVHDIL